MEYDELIAKARKGRSVNSLAKIWGVPQPTLNVWVKGEGVPPYDIAAKMVADAGVDPGEAFLALARAAQANKAKKFKLQMGFVQTPLYALLLAGFACCSFYIMSNRGKNGNGVNRLYRSQQPAA